jgi:CheY-like chemotaxis protein
MTERRILIVDDEPAILSDIERRLGEQFPLTTCNSPTEALEILKQSTDFGVVVTDMRMPEMSGLQFIAQAQAVSPDLIFIVLTGNVELSALIEAVNSRHIFKYLTKPSNTDELSCAIDAALAKSHEAESARQVLRATFSGAVDLMSDLLNSTHPVLAAVGERVKQLVPLACKQAGWQPKAELEIASRMCLVGFSTLSESQTQELIDASTPFSDATEAAIRQGLKNSRQLLARIPRLQNICCLIDKMFDQDSSDSDNERYGQLLGLLFLHTFATRKPGGDPIELLKRWYPNISAECLGRMQQACQQFSAGASDAEPVAIKLLLAGMVLAEDVMQGNKPILRKGDVITDRIREHLIQFSGLQAQVSAYALDFS